MDKEKLSLAITIGVSAAVHLKKDKRFADVKPLVPIVDGLLGSDDPKLITITAVGESNEPYVVVFTKEMAKGTADRFYAFIKRIEAEEKTNGDKH